MSAIVISCPRTQKLVPVGIEIDRESFDAMPVAHSTMKCPECGAEHVWSKVWARLSDEPQPTPADRVLKVA